MRIKKFPVPLLLSFLMALAFIACEVQETLEADDRLEQDRDTRFCTANNLSRSLLTQMVNAANLQHSSDIDYPFCIYTEDIPRNVQTENKVQEWATIAMNTWIEPLIGEPGWKVTHAEAYRVQPTSSGCPSKHNGLSVYRIRINNMHGANNSYPGFQMNMGNWGVHELVVLHEMGHAIGLGDTYSYDGHKPLGQPSATMKNQWNLKGVLQQDDKDAIRFIWARLRGEDNPCPAGYIIGEVEGTNWSGEVYCVPGDDGGGGDGNCSDNNYYTDPQGYSCSDWVGYDCNVAEESYGYSAKEEKEIKSNCQKSCNLCSDADTCPNDPNKTEPGICGCGTSDKDNDGDGTANCKDSCPSDPNKTAPGECGCGKDEGTCGGGGDNATYQAEDFTSKNGCSFETQHAGFLVSGYMDYGGNGTWIEWNDVLVAVAGNYTLTFRYANGGSKRRQSAIIVNGVEVGNVGFAYTGSWKSWQTDSITVYLRKGNNAIRVKANTGDGGPNLDSMDLPS